MNPNAVDNLPKDEHGNIVPGPGRPTFRDAILKVGAEIEGNMTQTERSVRAQFKKAIEDGDTQAWKALAQHVEGSKADLTSGGEPINPIQVYIPSNGRDESPI